MGVRCWLSWRYTVHLTTSSYWRRSIEIVYRKRRRALIYTNCSVSDVILKLVGRSEFTAINHRKAQATYRMKKPLRANKIRNKKIRSDERIHRYSHRLWTRDWVQNRLRRWRNNAKNERISGLFEWRKKSVIFRQQQICFYRDRNLWPAVTRWRPFSVDDPPSYHYIFLFPLFVLCLRPHTRYSCVVAISNVEQFGCNAYFR